VVPKYCTGRTSSGNIKFFNKLTVIVINKVIIKKVIASRKETRSKANISKKATIPSPKLVMYKNTKSTNSE
jgi:hypothetical protein